MASATRRGAEILESLRFVVDSGFIFRIFAPPQVRRWCRLASHRLKEQKKDECCIFKQPLSRTNHPGSFNHQADDDGPSRCNRGISEELCPFVVFSVRAQVVFFRFFNSFLSSEPPSNTTTNVLGSFEMLGGESSVIFSVTRVLTQRAEVI